MHRALVLLVLATLVVGCGTKSHRIVRISARDLGGHGTIVAVARPSANGREAPLESVRPLVPLPLPLSRRCSGEPVVAITFSDGRVVRYGSCALPQSIRILQLGLTSEVRQWDARPASHATIAGARPRERAALRRLLKRLAPSRIRSVKITPLRTFKRWRAPGGSVMLSVDAGPSLRGQWETSLLGNLYAAEADRLGLRPVGLVASRSGMSRPGVVGGAQVSFAAVRRAVRAGGAHVVELRRQGGALALTLRADKPAAFLKHHGRRVVRTLQPKSSFGVTSIYVGAEDASGAIVYAWGWLPAEGMMWARPDLDACGPIFHSQPVGYHGPPCAA